jgi:hypothetical protein
VGQATAAAGFSGGGALVTSARLSEHCGILGWMKEQVNKCVTTS